MMNSRTLVTRLLATIALVISLAWCNYMPSQEISSMNSSSTITAWGGSYIDYDEATISSLSGDIVLFFHADWCPTCRQAQTSFLENGIPAWLTIVKVNYDKETALKRKYSVLSQTSYVLIKPDGTIIKRWIGGIDIDSIIEKITEAKTNTSSQAIRVGSDQIAKAYFAGGCFWCMEWPLEALDGVKWVISWYMWWTRQDARYEIVSQGTTKHRETVEVSYDPALVTYQELLDTYRRQIDPTDSGGQFADRWEHYRTAIYYSDPQQQATATAAKQKLQDSGKFDQPIAVEILPVSPFYPAEEYHQDYYKKNSNQYDRYKKWSWREDYIDETWTNESSTYSAIIPWQQRPPKDISQLTDIQRKILFDWGTEPPFDNPYRDNKEAGIYVDVIDGTPLFSSLDKFDSGTWRPSFTKPISQSWVWSQPDMRLGMMRTEITSSSSSWHLWHVFDDGPNGWDRYCINSAALEFIPATQLEARGYGEYMNLF